MHRLNEYPSRSTSLQRVNGRLAPAAPREPRLPAGPLKPTFIDVGAAHGTIVVPVSMGQDGYVYCAHGSSRERLARSNDAFATIDLGYNFGTAEPGFDVMACFKTFAGWSIILKNPTTDEGRLYFLSTASGWAGVPTKVRDTWGFSTMSCNHYEEGPINSVILAAEYSGATLAAGKANLGVHKLWRSLDGGQTFDEVFATTVNGPAGDNSHLHTAVYDPYFGRCWLAWGDGPAHSSIWYSNQMGAAGTWIEFCGPTKPVPRNDIGAARLQPTILIPTHDKLILVEDASDVRAGVLALRRDLAMAAAGNEHWYLERLLSIGDRSASAYFGRGPVCRHPDGSIYALIPTVDALRDYYIVASGDAGQSWHVVYGINLKRHTSPNFSDGLVGPDAGGHFYGYVQVGTSWLIAKFAPVTWI